MSNSEATSTTGSSRAISRASSRTSFSMSPTEVKRCSTSFAKEAELGLVRRQTDVRNICFVGAGYVGTIHSPSPLTCTSECSYHDTGGPTAAIIAYCNPNISVTVVDMNETRIQRWQSKHLPIHEPGLEDVVRIARDGANEVDLSDNDSDCERRRLPCREPNLFFSTDCNRHIAAADIVFLSVNTPTKMSGLGAGAATDISMFESAARSVALVAKEGAIIVEKSTVPCRTAKVVRDIFNFHRPGVPFEILSNPEFLAEGTAVNDLLHPSRVLIGSAQTPAGKEAASKLTSVYAGWVPRSLILNIGLWSSELSKLVANAMLAQRISSINSISAICEKTGADINDVAHAVGVDPRIGAKFLQAGLGFGGSCFKKDVLSLSYLAESLDLPEVAVVNTLNGSLRGKKITLLGYAFKKDTSDTRESQAAEVVRQLLPECPFEIAIFDPQCGKGAIEEELAQLASSQTAATIKPHGPVAVYTDPYEACANATAVLILTEWTQFSYPPSAPKPSTLEANSVSTRHIRPTLQPRQMSQMNLLERRAAVQDDLAKLQDTHPYIRPDPQNDEAGRFRSAPKCSENCVDCESEHTVARYANQNLDWVQIAGAMAAPRWVFDGRGMVDPVAMEDLGFQVKAIGRGCSGAPDLRVPAVRGYAMAHIFSVGATEKANAVLSEYSQHTHLRAERQSLAKSDASPRWLERRRFLICTAMQSAAIELRVLSVSLDSTNDDQDAALSSHPAEYIHLLRCGIQVSFSLWPGRIVHCVRDDSGSICTYVSPDATTFTSLWSWRTNPAAVRAFPNIGIHSSSLPVQVSDLETLEISSSWTLAPSSLISGTSMDPTVEPNSGAIAANNVQCNVVLDMFADEDERRSYTSSEQRYELMVWFGSWGAAARPIGSSQPRDPLTIVMLGASAFTLFNGTNTNGQTVFSWVSNTTLTTFSLDIAPLIGFLVANDYMPADAFLGTLQFGSETSFASGEVNFTVHAFEAYVGSRPTDSFGNTSTTTAMMPVATLVAPSGNGRVNGWSRDSDAERMGNYGFGIECWILWRVVGSKLPFSRAELSGRLFYWRLKAIGEAFVVNAQFPCLNGGEGRNPDWWKSSVKWKSYMR
nr:udp-glucose 6-dehydrogenase 3 [Quercus suber]